MIEVQCTSCHTRYRIDEQVLPEGVPTFKCSRCGHVFSFEPRQSRPAETRAAGPKPAAQPPPRSKPDPKSGAEAAPSEESSATGTATGKPDPSEEPAASPSPESAAEPNLTATAGAASQPVASEDQARRTEQFFSRLLAERKFAEKEEDQNQGDNLAFDFGDEEPSPDEVAPSKPTRRKKSETPPQADKWEVGDDSTFDDPAGRAAAENIFRVEEEAPPRKRQRKPPAPQFLEDDEFVNEDEAPVYNRAITHSARFFLMMFLLVGAGFGVMTFMIHNAPAGAAEILSHFPLIGERFQPPATPARLVALRDVHADYQRSRDGRTALLLTGTAENVGMNPLHVVQVSASLRDASRRPLASQSVYCGNNLSAKMVSQMTPHEIEFFQKLDPPKTFSLDPSGTCQFVIVFIDPPSGVNSFAMSVAQAIPTLEETAAPPPP